VSAEGDGAALGARLHAHDLDAAPAALNLLESTAPGDREQAKALLHAVSPVTRGRRYAFLPFLYDDEAAKIREANNPHLGEGIGAYRG